MYNAFFEFEQNPFSPKPDLAYFYRSKQHDASLRSLMFTVQSRMGLSSLTGEEGTGKSMLLECLRDTLESTQIQCAYLRDSRISSSRFFETIASELDLRCQGTSAYQVFSALHQFTLQQAGKGRTVALIVDDAHNLSADVLNEILHLASLHDDKVKLLQTVLAGRPQLLPTLDTLNLERLKQHAILSCHLDPFTAEETRNYIEFRLAQAGLPDQTIFPPDAFSEIHLRSRGYAPAIHAICEGLLLAAFTARSKVCTPEILDQVFRNSRGAEAQVEGTAGTVVAVTRIDLARLVAPSEPEPALLTALLRLTFGAIKTLPPPLPVNANDMLEPLRDALRQMFPARTFALPVGEFPVGSKKPMPLTDGARNLSSVTRLVQPQIHAIPTAVALSTPVLSKPAVLAEPRPERKLRRIRPGRIALIASSSVVHATPIDFASVVLQPANSAIESLKARTAMLSPKSVTKLSRLSCRVKPHYGNLTQAYTQASALDVPATFGPARPTANLQPMGEGWRRTPLAKLPAGKPSSGILNQVAAQVSALDVPATFGPAQPTAKLQPTGEGWRRTSLAHLPAIKPNSGVLSHVDAEVLHVPAELAAAHPHAEIQPIGEGWRQTSMLPLSTRPEPPATATELRKVVPTAAQFTGSVPFHPGIPAGEARQAVAPRISNTLVPLPCSVEPSAVVAGAPANSQAGSVSVAPSLQPVHPAANLQTAGTTRLPRVPVTPFGAAVSNPPSPRTSGDSQVQLSLQNPIGPRMAADPTVLGESNVAEQNHLFSLACNVPPSAPPVETPIKNAVKPVQSLRPHGPVSNLEPVNPRSSWLLLPSWKPVETNTAAAAVEPASFEPASVEARKPFSFRPKVLLTLATPILIGLMLYSLSPAVLPGADALNQHLRRAHQAVLDRAAVELREDFRTGLDDWMNRGGARPAWSSDASGFIHPSSLALYRPSLGLADYQMQFVGTIDKKALSWVVRAADFNNYYAVRLSVLKPGPVPAIVVTRYAVIDGKIQNQVTTPLLMSARSDTVYRVSLNVEGDHYALSVQDQPVDSWSESKLAQGGIGFFSDQDAASRVTAVQVKGQYDMLGRLCAFLAPSAVTSYRASLNEHAALALTDEMNARSGGRGGMSNYGRRLPHGTARLDPAFWQVPELNVPNARRCSPPSGRGGFVRTRHASPYTGASSSTTCY